jgi:hypothetical protein
MTNAPKSAKTAARTKIVHEARLDLPQDVEGFSINFRRESARTVGRIMADERKLAVFLTLLEKFSEYATDKFEDSLATRAAALADKAAKLKADQAEALRKAGHIVNSKRAEVAKLTLEIDAHDAKVKEEE